MSEAETIKLGWLAALTARPDLVFQAQQLRKPWVRLVALELCVLYFAWVAPFRRRRVELPAGTQVFDNHAEAQRLLLALCVVTVMEAVPMHFLLRAWRPWFAWVVLALTLYSLCYIVAASRALSARPHLLSAERLLLRVGLFFTVDIAREAIVHAALYFPETPQPEVVALKFISKPNLFVELSAPTRVYGPFGRTQLATRLAVYAEQADELVRKLG